MVKVKTGIEKFIDNPPEWVSGKRLGLLCNPASVDRNFCHSRELICKKFPGQLTALFSPQHGFFAEKQDNMIESDDITDPVLNVPVFSLYGKTRKPDKKMFDLLDILVVDLQDVGTRVYTFIYTMANCLEASKQYNKKVIILDRPNPVNGNSIEGNCLSPDYASFVGKYPIPMRHGLTIGELALMFNDHFNIGCDLEVIPMTGWSRGMFFKDTGLPWISPSPNLPTPESAIVYPGQVIWEGTNISEGRGTALPFELFGAPFIDTNKIISFMEGNRSIPGAFLRPTAFEPTSNKHKGRMCKGFQIHITDPQQYRPYFTSLKLLQAIVAAHKKQFKWKDPPYEYEFKKLPIDLIIGSKKIRKQIENLENIEKIQTAWQENLCDYIKTSGRFHIYT
jgi:uncharacterized protein YbbC (DUF1343 family)